MTTAERIGEDARLRAAIHRALADVVAQVGHIGTGDVVTGTLAIRQARGIVAAAKAAQFLAVIVAAEGGQDWGEIGGALGMDPETAETVYGGAVRRWRSGDSTPWLPGA